MVTAALSQLHGRLIAEAEQALVKAELYARDKKVYRHNWARIYIQRVETALAAAALLEEELVPS